MAAEKNSTLVLPFPVELLRFLESNTSLTSAISSAQRAVEKVTEEPGKALPDVKERLASAPQVAALETREQPEKANQPVAAPPITAARSGSAVLPPGTAADQARDAHGVTSDRGSGSSQ